MRVPETDVHLTLIGRKKKRCHSRDGGGGCHESVKCDFTHKIFIKNKNSLFFFLYLFICIIIYSFRGPHNLRRRRPYTASK